MEIQESKRFDVLIIGAGPAGTAAAIACTHLGVRPVVVTKPYCDPKSVVPVQSVHPGVVSMLSRLGIEEVITKSSQGTFTGITTNDGYNRLSTEAEEWDGHHINRALFDRALLEQLHALEIPIIETALKADQINHSDTEVRIQLDPVRNISAPFMIDATGYHRMSKRTLHLREKFYSSPLQCWTGLASKSKLKSHYELTTSFLKQKDGWLWLAPHDDEHVTWTKLSQQKQRPDAFIEQYQAHTVQAYNVRWRAFRPVCHGRALLCGDAAGSLDPAAGQGILNALKSGIVVANCVLDCLNDTRMKEIYFVHYDQWFIENFEDKVAQLNEYYKLQNLEV